MSTNSGGGGGGRVAGNEDTCAHGAQINFGDLTPYLTYDLIPISDLRPASLAPVEKFTAEAVDTGGKFIAGISAVNVNLGKDVVRCGSDCSASACCTAGPSSYLGSAPLEEALYRADAMRITRVVLYV